MNRPALRFAEVIERLDKLVQEASTAQDEKHKEILLSFVVVKLHDQWNFRSRQIVLESFGRSEEAMTETIRRNWGITVRDKGFEPDWHIPSNTIKAACLLKVPDLTQIQDAIGSVIYIDDIRWTRNAIAHNIPTSFTKYRQMTLSKYQIQDVMPYRLPLETNAETGNSIYEDWCNELGNALRFAL